MIKRNPTRRKPVPNRPPPAQGALRGGRGRRQRLLLYGVHAVLAALANPLRRVSRLMIAPERRGALEPAIAGALARSGRALEPEERPKRELDVLLGAEAAHQGLVLETAPLGEQALEDLLARIGGAARSVLVVLDQVTDPQNVGAIVRSAAAFGVAGLVLQSRHAPPETGALAKAASGGIEHVPIVRVTNLARALGALKGEGFWVVGLDSQAPTTLAMAALEGRVALVLGAEGVGLRRLTRERCDAIARLPIKGPIDSLNVSAAAAAALYELFRVE
jgi:23S rRNA (guanosine2251-2'-O)-methyltransferase